MGIYYASNKIISIFFLLLLFNPLPISWNISYNYIFSKTIIIGLRRLPPHNNKAVGIDRSRKNIDNNDQFKFISFVYYCNN